MRFDFAMLMDCRNCGIRLLLELPTQTMRLATMSLAKLPKHAVLIRWGAFQLNVVGRTAILGWVGVAGALIGAKHYFGY
jgi:hypothetical protein